MRLNGLDLNLLVALDALLDEQHVTRAGERVGLTQSAMSDALARLRRHYDDELLARHGNRFRLTPLGEALRDRVADAVAGVTDAFGARATFDPTTSTRAFRVYATGIGLVVARPLLDRIRETAPRVSVTLLDMHDLERGEAEFRRADGVILPRGVHVVGGMATFPSPSTALGCQDLYRDEWKIVSAGGATPPATLDELRDRPWVSAYGARSTVMRHLATLGVEPPVVAGVQDFTAVPFMVTGSSRVAALPERFALMCARHGDLRIDPFPVAVPPLVEAFWWHPNHTHDAGHRWLRDEIAAVAASLDENDHGGPGGSGLLRTAGQGPPTG